MEASISIGDERSRAECRVVWLSVILAIILILSFIAMVVIPHFSEYVGEDSMLFLTIVYLAVYYIQEYIPHQEWIIYNEGIMSARGQNPIEWQNIIHYEVIELKDKKILRVAHKGRGVVTRKSDFILEEEKRSQIIALFQSKVVGG